jgi:hypothetical protein
MVFYSFFNNINNHDHFSEEIKLDEIFTSNFINLDNEKNKEKEDKEKEDKEKDKELSENKEGEILSSEELNTLWELPEDENLDTSKNEDNFMSHEFESQSIIEVEVERISKDGNEVLSPEEDEQIYKELYPEEEEITYEDGDEVVFPPEEVIYEDGDEVLYPEEEDEIIYDISSYGDLEDEAKEDNFLNNLKTSKKNELYQASTIIDVYPEEEEEKEDKEKEEENLFKNIKDDQIEEKETGFILRHVKKFAKATLAKIPPLSKIPLLSKIPILDNFKKEVIKIRDGKIEGLEAKKTGIDPFYVKVDGGEETNSEEKKNLVKRRLADNQ